MITGMIDDDPLEVLQAENDRLRAALKPFADASEKIDPSECLVSISKCGIVMGWSWVCFDNARKAMENK